MCLSAFIGIDQYKRGFLSINCHIGCYSKMQIAKNVLLVFCAFKGYIGPALLNKFRTTINFLAVMSQEGNLLPALVSLLKEKHCLFAHF